MNDGNGRSAEGDEAQNAGGGKVEEDAENAGEYGRKGFCGDKKTKLVIGISIICCLAILVPMYGDDARKVCAGESKVCES